MVILYFQFVTMIIVMIILQGVVLGIWVFIQQTVSFLIAVAFAH